MPKKLSKPCVMTIYNWHRKGLHPRLLAWRWAVNQADRRWYISEFVWDSWEKKRRKGSGRLPVISRMPRRGKPFGKKEGIFIYRKVGTQQGNSYFAAGICQIKSGSQRMASYHAWGWTLAGRSFVYDSGARDKRSATAWFCQRIRKAPLHPRKQNGWSPLHTLRKT